MKRSMIHGQFAIVPALLLVSAMAAASNLRTGVPVSLEFGITGEAAVSGETVNLLRHSLADDDVIVLRLRLVELLHDGSTIEQGDQVFSLPGIPELFSDQNETSVNVDWDIQLLQNDSRVIACAQVLIDTESGAVPFGDEACLIFEQ